MSRFQGNWFSSRHRGSMAWILLVFLLPLPALLESGHACGPDLNLSSTSSVITGPQERREDSSGVAGGCPACKLLRNLMADGGAPEPALVVPPARSLCLPRMSLPATGFHSEMPLLPRPPPAHPAGQSA